MENYLIAETEQGLSRDEIRQALLRSLEGRAVRKALILPPDFTRFHSGAGFITNVYYHALTERGAAVDILPALGTHEPMTDGQLDAMFGDIPHERFFVHDWRHDVVKLGEIPEDYVREITDGLWTEAVGVEINRRVMDEMMGRDHTPVRKLFDYGMEHFLKNRPILFALTVTTAPGGEIRTHGLFLGEGRECLTQAVKLAQEKNIDFVPHRLKKCVVYLDPSEFKSTWLGNKAVYRTRMAMADGGELIILAPGVEKFGEDAECDRLVRKYGYRGRLHTLEEFRKPENADLRENMGAAAHLIHGSSDGRFSVTYAVKNMSRAEIEAVGYQSADYDALAEKYDPQRLAYGYNTLDGEEIYFIPNPAGEAPLS